ncbi:hypothetical protein Hanom_Chr05g00415311 [Helianthus anomalus]
MMKVTILNYNEPGRDSAYTKTPHKQQGYNSASFNRKIVQSRLGNFFLSEFEYITMCQAKPKTLQPSSVATRTPINQ